MSKKAVLALALALEASAASVYAMSMNAPVQIKAITDNNTQQQIKDQQKQVSDLQKRVAALEAAASKAPSR